MSIALGHLGRQTPHEMFGIGAGEFFVFAVVVLLVVGPKSMPKFMQAVGKGLREFRRASNELRRQAGIDDLMRGDPLGAKQLARDIQRNPPPPRKPQKLTSEDLERETPPEGPDLAHAKHLLEQKQQEAERERLKQEESDDEEEPPPPGAIAREDEVDEKQEVVS